MKAEQLELIRTTSAPTLSPDGRFAVVAATRPSFAADDYVGQLWEVDTTDHRAPRRITAGKRDTKPRFSPDGTMIGFLRADAKGRGQFAIVDARGGEARVLTDAPLGIQDFTWDRESTRVALVAAMPAEGRYGTTEGVGAGKEDPRRITGNRYKMNGRGYTGDQPVGILILRVPPLDEEPWVAPVGRAAKGQDPERDLTGPNVFGGENGLPCAVLVTPEGRDAYHPEFSPRGNHLYFTAALHDEHDEDLRTMVHRVKLKGPVGPQGDLGIITPDEAEATKLPSPQIVAGGEGRAYGLPRFSKDGETLFLVGGDLGETNRDFVARQNGIFAVDTDDISGKKPAKLRELTDRDAVDYADPHLVPYGERDIAAIARVRGAAELHAITPSGKTRTIVGGQRVITGAACAPASEGSTSPHTLVVTFTDPTTPGELGLVEGVNGKGVIRSLTTFAAALNRETHVVMPNELTVKSADGYPVHGWVFLPEGEGPHPVLLNIHGGPHADYTWGWFDEAQVYAQAGYAVVMCNPRGSAGYGRKHGLAIKEAMGTLDFQDVIAFLEGALASEPSLDGERLGIMGGSYGGYLTAWTIAHDHRFSAAIVERGYLDPGTFIGTSDIGWFFSEEYTGADPEHAETQSPMAFVGQVETPTLVIHSEEDWRCPIEQAQRWFAALRRTGTPTEMLVFPGENHELSRSGTPWHRRQRFEAILEWLSRHLPVER